jgi:hypothetical protein
MAVITFAAELWLLNSLEVAVQIGTATARGLQKAQDVAKIMVSAVGTAVGPLEHLKIRGVPKNRAPGGLAVAASGPSEGLSHGEKRQGGLPKDRPAQMRMMHPHSEGGRCNHHANALISHLGFDDPSLFRTQAGMVVHGLDRGSLKGARDSDGELPRSHEDYTGFWPFVQPSQ